MPDYKEIGLSAKDILMGVVTVVAGAEGGRLGRKEPSSSTGADGVIGMAGSSVKRLRHASIQSGPTSRRGACDSACRAAKDRAADRHAI